MEPCPRTCVGSMCHPSINCLSTNLGLTTLDTKDVYNPSLPLSHTYVENTLQWRHNGLDCVSYHQPQHCLLNRLFRRRSKKTPKLRVTSLCVGNSPGTGEFPAQMASNVENVSIWWRHHDNTHSHEWINQISCACIEINTYIKTFWRYRYGWFFYQKIYMYLHKQISTHFVRISPSYQSYECF